MARKRKGRTKQKEDLERDYIQVDAYYIPREQAELYQALREAVADEVGQLLKEEFSSVERLSEDPDLGEALVAYDETGEPVFRYYLNPANLSEAQKARDKHQLETYLEDLLSNSRKEE